MVKSGEFYPGRDGKTSGWFRSGYGKHIYIWGSMTIQGLLGYYYNEIEPLTSVELNRCRFNQIGENPRRSSIGGRLGNISPWDTHRPIRHTVQCNVP
mmetsp:Transcript_50087/g.121364  ORF Transcript_50087/g.121364 Transcript_50087/m.121364 type:complete len:97 (+) Transcript_50087:1534-1824(+)